MSRIGNKPIVIPAGVTVQVADGRVAVKGPKGSLYAPVVAEVSVRVDGGQLLVARDNDTPTGRARHGLMRALTANMVEGVSRGFERKLEISGVGYKAEVKGSSVVLALGYSHPVVYPFPDGITIAVDAATKLTVKGINKERVGQVAAELRSLRSPDSYKGKGVRYAGETVRLKPGKSAQKK